MFYVCLGCIICSQQKHSTLFSYNSEDNYSFGQQKNSLFNE